MSERLISADEIVRALEGVAFPPRWMNSDDCARYLRCSLRTFREKTCIQPDFPKPGKIVGAGKLWDRRLIDAYVERQANRAA